MQSPLELLIMTRYDNTMIQPKNGEEIMKKVEHNVKARSNRSSSSSRKSSNSSTGVEDGALPVKIKASSSTSSSSSSSSSAKKTSSTKKKDKDKEKDKGKEKESSSSKRSRSKSRSRKSKTKQEEDIPFYQQEIVLDENDRYESWDFGKIKTFKKPKNNTKNNRAATTIERFVRGWWARIQFKIQMLEFKINNKDLLTKRALAKVSEKTKSKKEKVRNKMMQKHQDSLNKTTKEEKAAQEAQKLIHQLRDENKKLREKNQKVYDAGVNLKEQNERLENATSQAEGNIGTLNTHAKHIQETHDKLKIVVPRYKASVDQLLEAVELRRQFILTERAMKVLYVKCVGSIVDLAEEKIKDMDLVDEIVGYVLDTEVVDNEEPLPEKVSAHDPDHDEGDNDSVDEFTVATYGG